MCLEVERMRKKNQFDGERVARETEGELGVQELRSQAKARPQMFVTCRMIAIW